MFGPEHYAARDSELEVAAKRVSDPNHLFQTATGQKR